MICDGNLLRCERESQGKKSDRQCRLSMTSMKRGLEASPLKAGLRRLLRERGRANLGYGLPSPFDAYR
jgi:hypothetical protein